jgi:hypothetical protein
MSRQYYSGFRRVKYGSRNYGYTFDRRRRGPREIDPLAVTILAILIAIWGIYEFIIKPAVAWMKDHWIAITVTIVIIVIIIIFSFYISWKDKRKEEQSMKRKGLVRYVTRHGKELWVRDWQIEQLKLRDEEDAEKEKVFNQIVREIEEFKPARDELRNEYAYHLSLYHWLKRTFSQAGYEKQRGSSRPDIVINDIAIEIKGPTDHEALKTIADKCMRYAKHFPEGLIVVLFEVNVNRQLYEEWYSSLQEQWPHVKVIKK